MSTTPKIPVGLALVAAGSVAFAQAKPAAKPVTAPAAPAIDPAKYQETAQFKPDFKGPKTGKDPKHTPKLAAPDSVEAGAWFDVTISVGHELVHPTYFDHHVEWIALFKNDVEIARAYLHPVFTQPKVTFTIALDETSTIKAVEAPNHTAPWTSDPKVITVKPGPQTAAPASGNASKTAHAGH